MSQKKLLVRWKTNRSVKDAKFAEASALLEHHGFVFDRKTKHTSFWTHELLEDLKEMYPGQTFSLKEPHAKGKVPSLYSQDVRRVVDVIGHVEQGRRRKEEEQQASAGGEVPALAYEMPEVVDAEEVVEDED